MTTLIIPTTVHPADAMFLRQVIVSGENDEFEVELALAGAQLIFQRKVKSATEFAEGRDVQSIHLEQLTRAWIAAIDDDVPTEDEIVEQLHYATGFPGITEEIDNRIRAAVRLARGEQR